MKKTLLFVALTLSLSALSQDYRFGKVEEIDFQRITPEGEEEPAAEVLYRKENIYFRYSSVNGFVQYREVHERIKINDEKGLEYATEKVRLYNKVAGKRERLKNLKGYTFSLENNKVTDVKLKNSGEFEEELNEYWLLSSFTMPNVGIGSIIEYEYTIVSPFLAIDDVVIQYDIPIRKLYLRIEMVEYFTYNVFFNPKASYVPDLTKNLTRDKITTSEGQYGDSSAQQYELNNQALVIDTQNIPALTAEPMVDALSNYRSKIKFELASIRYPNQPMEYFSTNWESVAKSIYENKDFGRQLERKSFYEEDLENVLKVDENAKEVVYTIYDFLKKKVKWNKYYGITCQKGVKDAYEEGSGNVADVNLLLTSMLNSQNIEAYPLLISSQDNGTPLFPTREGFDYVAVVAIIDGEQILLDATDDNLDIGELPYRAANWKGRAISKDGNSFWVEITPDKPSSETIISNVFLNEDMSITGKTSKRLTNYIAYNFRDTQGTRNVEEIKTYLKSDTPGLEIIDLEIKNVEQPDKPIDYSYNIKLNNSAEKIGDKIYLSPLLNEGNDENPFKLEERKLPIDLKFPIDTKTIINLSIPVGYEVVSLPESVQYNYNDQVGYYKFIVTQNANKITVMADFEMKQSTVLPSDYHMWKDFFTAIVAKDAEKIVLKKI